VNVAAGVLRSERGQEMAVTDLRFSVLGPVRAWRGNEELPLGPPQRRAVLATLLLRHGNTVTTAELVDGMWGDEAPPRAVGALRTHVLALRHLLEPERPRRAPAKNLVSAGDGYALRIPAESLDLTLVSQRLTQAREWRNAGELTKAHDQFSRALEMWHGEALAGLTGPYLAAQRAQLAELRLDALEARIELGLELDQHALLIPELVALSSQHPLRERLRALLMTALVQSGRQAEALDVYADIQHRLADELGIDPGPELADLHRRIQSGHGAIDDVATPRTLTMLAADQLSIYYPSMYRLTSPLDVSVTSCNTNATTLGHECWGGPSEY